jgi:hypothetical protein
MIGHSRSFPDVANLYLFSLAADLDGTLLGEREHGG